MVCVKCCSIKSMVFVWRKPAKRPEAFGFALIFFVSFLYQDKKEKTSFNED
jgi:hypothetical protein